MRKLQGDHASGCFRESKDRSCVDQIATFLLNRLTFFPFSITYPGLCIVKYCINTRFFLAEQPRCEIAKSEMASPQKIQDPIPMFFPSQNVLTFMLANRLVIITPRRRIQH